MRANVTITDMKGSESRTKTFDFKDYDELNRLVRDFEEETKFRRVDVSISAAGDDELDAESVKDIENGDWAS